MIKAAEQASNAILEIYHSDFEVEIKADNSPVTIADKTSSKILCEALGETGILIISEEEVQADYEVRKDQPIWLVDPLDGTKEFIKGNDEYSALVWENRSFFNGKILNASVEFNQLNPNDILERIRFNIPNQLPWDSYYEYLNLFKDLFGKPQDCSMFSHSGSPLDKWIVCDVEIAIGIDQMWDDCLIFNIYKTKA